MGLNYVHEASYSLYIKQVNNGAVADTLLGDDLVGAQRAILVEERVDNAFKRVRKLTAATKTSVGPRGRGGQHFLQAWWGLTRW